MMQERILILSSFGYQNNLLGGQTIKSRAIHALLKQKEKEYNFQTSTFDIQPLHTAFLRSPILLWRIFRCNQLVYIGSSNSVRYLFPFIFLFSKLSRCKIHAPVVGGRLDIILTKNPFLGRLYRKIDSILPQTEELKESLESKFGYRNVHLLHNFRVTTEREPPARDFHNATPLKMVFMARVEPMKGVDTLFELDRALTEEKLNATIDIYGPVLPSYREKFDESLHFSTKIRYCGVLAPEDVHERLSEYHLMLLPTRYRNEGFPGTLLDCYLTALPFIVTEWRYAREFVENGYSGIITPFDDDRSFIEQTLELIQNRDLLAKLSIGAAEYGQRYSSEEGWKILNRQLKVAKR